MDNAIFRLQRRFYCLPTNMIIKLYKIRCERLRMLMRKGMPEDVQMIIERNVRFHEFYSFFHLLGTGRSSYAKKRRVKRLGALCHKCARWTCKGKCRSIIMISINREDKIRFIKDGLCKENLDLLFGDNQITLESHPSGAVQRELLDLWPQFLYEWTHLGNLMKNDPVCQFLRKLDGKLVLDSEKAFKPFLDIKPEEDVSYNNNYYNAVENGFVSTKARNVLISATTIEELLDKL
ncbi:hypothetical protein ES319_A11G317900v1 [Gossypium barbadense]|uniref:Uncharacterized protein n=1 Tax=Gossypium barbadense TaxID=3634 RepID=A0A5J5TVM7_GOSBA|nr:hypothetical protein ES319_A11G317900v1 [Gossypium barbadense]